MEKIRSSKQLKESMQNIDKVIDNELLNAEIALDINTANAYIEDKEAVKHVEEVLVELDEKAADIIEESPAAEMLIKNVYTKQLKLDESIEDFRLQEDGRKHRIAARDEAEGDLYLEYDMLEFVYELLSAGSKGITNIAPKTPLVHRSKKPGAPAELLPMKKFSPNGSEVIDKEAVYLLDLAPTQSREISRNIAKIPETDMQIIKRYAYQVDGNRSIVQSVFDDLCDRLNTLVIALGRDAIGYAFLNATKVTSTPQISEAGNKVVIYSDTLDDFTQAAEGLMTYGITCEAPVPKRNKTSHWDYSMVVDVPSYSDGEPMSFEDWLAETGREVEDVMEPAVANRFRKRFAKADAAAEEFRLTKLTDDIIDEYADKAMDIDPDDTKAMKDLYADMRNKLAENGIKCTKEIRDRFADETGFEF